MGKGVIVFVRTSGIYYDSRASKEILSLVEGGYTIEVIGWDRTGGSLEKSKAAFSDVLENVSFRFFDLQISHLGIRNTDKLIRWMRYVKKELADICRRKK